MTIGVHGYSKSVNGVSTRYPFFSIERDYMKRIVVTGGSGFIGSNLIKKMLTDPKEEWSVLNIDKLTYAGNLKNNQDFEFNPRYFFLKSDINDMEKVLNGFNDFKPDAVMHLAAESHVDKSIESGADFIHTNINGTYHLLEVVREYVTLNQLQNKFKFLHVGTDEVYGSLGFEDEPFTEKSQYQPNSPYSASKAASDHLVRAAFKTYNIKTVTTHCSNNYGPQQLPEKLIPNTINKAFERRKIPVYGKGDNIRDWVHVDDHCDALLTVLKKGVPGESYCIGSDNEWDNLSLVRKICDLIDSILVGKEKKNDLARKNLIEFVTDRKGHDVRYAIDSSKIQNELGWKPKVDFEEGLKDTILWYLNHQDWWTY